MVVRRLLIAVLVIAGVTLVVFGTQRWLDHRAAGAVATDFVEALRDGDRDAALAQLTAQLRSEVEGNVGGKDSPFWAADAEFSYRIHHVELDGDNALVQLWIDKGGFVLEPILHLQRGETGSWKIERIENLHIDPKWFDLQLERAQLQGKADAVELRKALKSRPGVTVERAPLPGRGE